MTFGPIGALPIASAPWFNITDDSGAGPPTLIEGLPYRFKLVGLPDDFKLTGLPDRFTLRGLP